MRFHLAPPCPPAPPTHSSISHLRRHRSGTSVGSISHLRIRCLTPLYNYCCIRLAFTSISPPLSSIEQGKNSSNQIQSHRLKVNREWKYFFPSPSIRHRRDCLWRL